MLGDLISVSLVHLFSQQVDNALGLAILIEQGNDKRCGRIAEGRAQAFICLVKISVLFVNLGDVKERGQFFLLHGLPCLFGADSAAVFGRNNNNAAVSDAQRLRDLALEVKITRSIDDIDDMALVLDRSQRRGNGNLALDLFGVKVADSVSVRYLAQAVGPAGQKQQALRQRGLSVATVSQQANIADFVNGICHIRLSFKVKYRRSRREQNHAQACTVPRPAASNRSYG